MGFAVFVFIVIFLLISSAGLLLFYREAMLQRLSAVVSPDRKVGLLDRFHAGTTGTSIGALVQPFERVVPKSANEVSVIQKRLIRAGYRKDVHLSIFYGAKALVPLALIIIVTAAGLYQYASFFVYILAIGLGFLVPDFWLGNRISNRQLNVRLGLPDVLDLMVICIEAGLSVDQATVRASEELSASQPAISDELGIVVLEQHAGRPRSEAWNNFAIRTDIDSVRTLVSVLNQAEQFGTSVAKTLRVFAETLRTQRRQRVEELAAKTTVKLVFPLVLFIFPSLFLVTLGPAMITIMESFDKYLK
jgi:tight adherence protein C